MLWLSRRPEWQRSREFETTTRTSGIGADNSNSFGDEELDDPTSIPVALDDDDIPGKVMTRVIFQPTFDTTHTIYYRGHWLRVKRSRKNDGSGTEMLSIRLHLLSLHLPYHLNTLISPVSSPVPIPSSSSSSFRQKRNTRQRPSTAFKYTLPIPMAHGDGPILVTSAPWEASFLTLVLKKCS